MNFKTFIFIQFLFFINLSDRSLGQSCTSNYLIISEEVNNSVLVIDWNTKQDVTSSSCLSTVTGSEGVAVNNTDHIVYIASTIPGSPNISKVTKINTVTQVATEHPLPNGYYLHDAVLSADNQYLYVTVNTDQLNMNAAILKISTSTMSVVSTLDLTPQFPGFNIWGITFTPSGGLFVVVYDQVPPYNSAVVEINPSSMVYVNTVASYTNTLPLGITSDAAGDLWVVHNPVPLGSSSNVAFKKINTSGTELTNCVTDYSTISTSLNGIYASYAIRIGPDGNLYATAPVSTNVCVFKLDVNTCALSVAIPQAAVGTANFGKGMSFACTSTDVCVTPSCTAPTATVTAGQPSCTGSGAPNNGSLTVVGFTSGQRYQYSTGATFNSGSAIPASITAIPAGGVIVNNLSNTTQQYTVRIYDATDNNCFVDRTVSITMVTQPTAQCAPMPNTNCATPNGSATVTTNANQILWSTGANTATITGLSNATYTVTVTNTTTGCTNTCQAVVGSTTNLPTAQCAPMPNTNCAIPNGSATVTTNANQILWSTGANTATITGLSNATYTVTVTNTTTGCTNTCQAVVGSTTTLPTAQCDPMPNTNCASPNGSATVTTNANQILWSNGATTATITGLSANTYTVTVTNTTTGCTNTCQALVSNSTVSPTCTVAANSQASCANLTGGSATVTPSPAGTYTYLWSNGATTATITNLTGGPYTVTVTNTTSQCTGVCQITMDTPTNCCNINAITAINLECVDNNTPANITDNRIRFNALVTNTNASLTLYNVTINGGTTITPNTNVPYGVTQFTLGPGTAGGGATFTVTVTDSATPGCTQTFQIVDPGNCDPGDPVDKCPTPKCGTATMQANGN